MLMLHIIFISLFTTDITATPYCNQQLKLYQRVTENLNQKCPLATTNIATCCDLRAYVPEPIPAVYKTECCWCDAPFEAAKVYCDSCGGWTVIQRRKDGSGNFNRPWAGYENGFGDLNGEFWYGLKALHCLTKTGDLEIKIDFEFSNKTRSYLHYKLFKVGSAEDEYPVTINGFTGITPTDPFFTAGHSGYRFTTQDNDNDKDTNNNCAAHPNHNRGKGNGGWWYTNSACWNINPNLNYGSPYFIRLAGKWYTLGWIEMKIRPLNCIL